MGILMVSMNSFKFEEFSSEHEIAFIFIDSSRLFDVNYTTHTTE